MQPVINDTYHPSSNENNNCAHDGDDRNNDGKLDDDDNNNHFPFLVNDNNKNTENIAKILCCNSVNKNMVLG